MMKAHFKICLFPYAEEKENKNVRIRLPDPHVFLRVEWVGEQICNADVSPKQRLLCLSSWIGYKS